jgi:FkbM family methyltransferase
VNTIVHSATMPPLRYCFRHIPGKSAKLAVWKSVVAHTWWLEGPAIAKMFWGDKMSVDARDICGRFMAFFGRWEPSLTVWIERTLQPGNTFIDIGANAGYFSLLASHLVGPEGSVVAVEAAPRTFSLLRSNVLRNQRDNIRLLHAAAWDERSELEMFVSSNKIGGTSSLSEEWAKRWQLNGSCKVQAYPCSELFTPAEIANARIIKIDVEGAECRVCPALVPILKTGRKDLEMAVEVMTDALPAIQELFASYGFHTYQVANDYRAESYIYRSVTRPERLESIPQGFEQVDVIFSRKDEAYL